MKQINLTNSNKVAIVDDVDFVWLNIWRWKLSNQGRAVRTCWIGSSHKNRKLKTIHMHREINKTPVGFDTDHIDGNPLNNQRNNLRTVTHSVNLLNRPKQKNNKSGYKNIFWDKQTESWRVQFQVNNKALSLGRYKDIKDAIKARKDAEEKIWNTN